MIVRMSKIMIMGPLELLMDTLTLIQQLGIMEVDAEVSTSEEDVPTIVPQLMDQKAALEHQLLEKLRKKIDEVLFYLSQYNPPAENKNQLLTVETLLAVLPSHLATVRNSRKTIEKLVQEIATYEEYKGMADALDGFGDECVNGDIQCIGVKFEKKEDFAWLQQFLADTFRGKAVIEDLKVVDEMTSVGMIIAEKEEGANVRQALTERKVRHIKPPAEIETLPFQEQRTILDGWIDERKRQLDLLQKQESEFVHRWHGAYLEARARIDARLSLISLTASVVRTKMCFFIHGWIPGKDFQTLADALQEQFQGRVVVEETELVEKDFSRVPIALHNPAYFEPFELFTRLLPMPPYASFDLTPFIGIFFPIFFGMMLGDIGYGLILIVFATFLVKKFEKRKNLQDAGKILFISALYTIVFGLLYGELLGNIGHEYLGLKPIFFDRQASIVPMLCFAIAAGVVHVILGLVLGIIVSLRHHMKKEAVFKLVNIFIILCICVLIASYFTKSIVQVQKPLLLVIGVVTPALLVVGGLMAPLELLKNIGNIISYVRIMAIGLTSVLLAFVANYMVGRIGSVWAGIAVAVLLHMFNLLLGVFAPTIHSLRLHYVEFLSKFMEPGGKEFKPLGRKL